MQSNLRKKSRAQKLLTGGLLTKFSSTSRNYDKLGTFTISLSLYNFIHNQVFTLVFTFFTEVKVLIPPSKITLTNKSTVSEMLLKYI